MHSGAKYDIKYLEGKVLVQELNTKMIDEMKVVTNVQPTKEQLTDMEFGMKVVKYVKSNAICIVKDGVTLAIGGGQTSRVWALENAIHNNPDKDFNGSVLASDAFFPFNDCVQVAARCRYCKQLFNQVVQLEIKIQLIYVMKKISLWYLADIDTLDTRRLYMKVSCNR